MSLVFYLRVSITRKISKWTQAPNPCNLAQIMTERGTGIKEMPDSIHSYLIKASKCNLDNFMIANC